MPRIIVDQSWCSCTVLSWDHLSINWVTNKILAWTVFIQLHGKNLVKQTFQRHFSLLFCYQVLVPGDRKWQVSQRKCRQFFYVTHTFFITRLVTSLMASWCTRISSHSNVKSHLYCYCCAQFCDITTPRLQWFESLRRRRKRLLMWCLLTVGLISFLFLLKPWHQLFPKATTHHSGLLWVGSFWRECSAITEQLASVA